MDKILQESLLYDFYGELLTPHQRRIYEDVRFGDLSLSEAAEEYGISRQGVSDMLHRVEKSLNEYEEKLGLVARFLETRKAAGQIRALCDEIAASGDLTRLSKIKALTASMED